MTGYKVRQLHEIVMAFQNIIELLESIKLSQMW